MDLVDDDRNRNKKNETEKVNEWLVKISKEMGKQRERCGETGRVAGEDKITKENRK